MDFIPGYILWSLLTVSVSYGFLTNKVCYDEVGCFSSNAPFDNAMNELPDSPSEVQTQAYLWTKQNPMEPQEISYSNVFSIKKSNFNSSRPTKVLIHGYMSNQMSAVIANLSVAFLKMDDFNVIGINWNKGAHQFYPKAVANTRVVGAVVARLLKTLRDQMGLKLSDLHIIGHSLGAHISGYIGTILPGIARITGLDPAGPMFSKAAHAVRLDPEDALFVDIIHTDAVPLDDAGFGTMLPMGHIDFYPNGGQIQPGCPSSIKTTLEELVMFQFTEAVDSVSCAHSRSIWYFIESVLNTRCQFTAQQCLSWNDFTNNTCLPVTSVMGINSIRHPSKGLFYLKTNSQSPFCRFLTNKVCYDEVGCFSSDAPFDNAMNELPDSPNEVQAQAYIWTKQNPRTPQKISNSDVSTIRESNFNSSRPTKVLIHGYMSSKDMSPVIANLSVAFLNMDDFNVIGIDWQSGAHQFYPRAVANTRVVAAVVAKLLTTLRDQFGMKLSDLHVIGHSLGAHVSGYIGARIPGIARITGLDPAGPMFTKTKPSVRLDPTDAIFVDTIHTDAAPLDDAGFGSKLPMGHIDFYPNGGQSQPGCPPPVKTTLEELVMFKFSEAFDSVSCAHDRAIWLFIESVLNNQCQFTAKQCQSWNDFTSNTCSHVNSVMGINSIKHQAEGKFYLKTNSQSPFCVSN